MSIEYPLSAVATLAPHATSRFVGRHHEMEVVSRQYEEVRNGCAAVVLLVGEQGIGKSRLLHEFARQAWHDGATVLEGGASEAEGMPPYLPFLEALGRYILEAPLDQLREQVQPAAHILATILPELATRLGELPAPHPLPPEQVRLRLYEAVGTFIEKMSAPHALVLALDDLQYADSASLDLLYSRCAVPFRRQATGPGYLQRRRARTQSGAWAHPDETRAATHPHEHCIEALSAEEIEAASRELPRLFCEPDGQPAAVHTERGESVLC